VKDAHYLHEKGYLKFRGKNGLDVRTLSVKHCQFTLTADGADVADLIKDEPTLGI
jgi:hypothetical protein